MYYYYSVIPTDWDYKHEKEIKEQIAKGYTIPTQIEEVVSSCGSLCSYVLKPYAMQYVKDLKKRFPFITFTLMAEKRWGEKLIIKVY